MAEVISLPRLYTPLGKDEIRIFVLYPSSDPNARLEGRFQVQDLGAVIGNYRPTDWEDYEALSYVWGKRRDGGSILFPGGKLTVSLVLERILSCLRHVNKERRIWVDAICINEADKQEMYQQREAMQRIYGAAALLLVWLGEEDGTFKRTLKALKEPISAIIRGKRIKSNELLRIYRVLEALLLSDGEFVNATKPR